MFDNTVSQFDTSIEKIYFELDVIKFKNIILDELQRLRKSLLQFEKDRINIITFSGRSSMNSIYGQVSGSRLSKRAFELANMCGGEFSKCLTRYVPVEISYNIKEYDEKVYRNYTALEMYMSTLDYRYFDRSCLDIKDKINLILQYIKGEAKKVSL